MRKIRPSLAIAPVGRLPQELASFIRFLMKFLVALDRFWLGRLTMRLPMVNREVSTMERKGMRFLESRLQERVVVELRMRFPDIIFWHTPNGGRRSIRDAVRFKALGVKAGVPDLAFMGAAHGYHGLYIEVKYGRGRLSEDQLFFESRCIDEGYLYECHNSVSDIVELVRWYYGSSI